MTISRVKAPRRTAYSGHGGKFPHILNVDSTLMELSGQLDAPVALPPRLESPVPLGEETVWTLKQV